MKESAPNLLLWQARDELLHKLVELENMSPIRRAVMKTIPYAFRLTRDIAKMQEKLLVLESLAMKKKP